MGCGLSSRRLLKDFRTRYPATVSVLDDKEVQAPLALFHKYAKPNKDGQLVIGVPEFLEMLDAPDGLDSSVFFPYLWNMVHNEPIDRAMVHQEPLRDHQFVRLVEMICIPGPLLFVKSLFQCMARHENQNLERILNVADFNLWKPWVATPPCDVDDILREELSKREPDDESGLQTFTVSRFLGLYRRTPEIALLVTQLHRLMQSRICGVVTWESLRAKQSNIRLASPQIVPKAPGKPLKTRRLSGSRRYSALDSSSKASGSLRYGTADNASRASGSLRYGDPSSHSPSLRYAATDSRAIPSDRKDDTDGDASTALARVKMK